MSISSERLTITSFNDFQRLVFHFADENNVIIVDGKDDLIQNNFPGLETMYFCPSSSFTIESALAYLMTASEAARSLMGPVFATDHIELLTSIVQNAFHLDHIQLMLQVAHCVCPHTKLQLFRANSAPSSTTSSIDIIDITTQAIEVKPSQLWYVLFWAEWLQMDAVIFACRKEMMQLFTPSSSSSTSNSKHAILFEEWLANTWISESECSLLCQKLMRHFLDYGPTVNSSIKQEDFVHNNQQHSDSSSKLYMHDLYPQKPPPSTTASTASFVSPKTMGRDEMMEYKLPTPPLQPLSPHYHLDRHRHAPTSSTTTPSATTSHPSLQHSLQYSPNSILEIDNHPAFQSSRSIYATKKAAEERTEYDDDYTIDSWAPSQPPLTPKPTTMRASVNSNTESTHKSVKNTPADSSVDMTPQRMKRAPIPMTMASEPTLIPPNHPSPASQTTYIHSKPSKTALSASGSPEISSPQPYIHTKPPKTRSISPHNHLSPSSTSTSTAISEKEKKSSTTNLELAREIALLRLRHVKIQKELEKSKVQAMQALKHTNLQSLALKSAVIRVSHSSPSAAASSSPTRTRPLSFSGYSVSSDAPLPSSSSVREADDDAMDLRDRYAQARHEEVLQQQMLLKHAQQRAVQRIQWKKQEELRKQEYITRQEQYKASLTQQQRAQHVSTLIRKQQGSSQPSRSSGSDKEKAVITSVEETVSSRGGRSRSRSPGVAGSARKQVTFALGATVSSAVATPSTPSASTTTPATTTTASSTTNKGKPSPSRSTTNATITTTAASKAPTVGVLVDETLLSPSSHTGSVHHRYSMAALQAVAQGLSPTRAATPPSSSSRVITKSTIRPGNNNLNNNNYNANVAPDTSSTTEYQWPSPAQLQKIKEKQAQLRHQQQQQQQQQAPSTSSSLSRNTMPLKPPQRDVSPPNQYSNKHDYHHDSPHRLNKVGGKYSPPRSINDFEASAEPPHSLAHRQEVEQQQQQQQQQQSQMDQEPNSMLEVSFGVISGLSDDHCLGALQQIYLLVKYDHPLKSAGDDDCYDHHRVVVQQEPFRSPIVKCIPSTSTSPNHHQQQHHATSGLYYMADLMGLCMHIPSTAGDCWQAEGDNKVTLEIYAQQISMADECIAKAELSISELLGPFLAFQPNRSAGADGDMPPPQVWWQKITLFVPNGRRNEPAGEIEIAGQLISLYEE